MALVSNSPKQCALDKWVNEGKTTLFVTYFKGIIEISFVTYHFVFKLLNTAHDISIEISKTEKQAEKRLGEKKKKTRISKNCGTTTKGVLYVQCE